MQADAVELRQVITRQQLFETVVIQAGAVVGGSREFDGMGRHTRVKVRTDKRTRVGGRVDVDRHALTEAQFAVHAVVAFQRGEPAQQQAVTQEHRIDLPAIAVGVAFVGEITFVPGVAHGYSLLFLKVMAVL